MVSLGAQNTGARLANPPPDLRKDFSWKRRKEKTPKEKNLNFVNWRIYKQRVTESSGEEKKKAKFHVVD